MSLIDATVTFAGPIVMTMLVLLVHRSMNADARARREYERARRDYRSLMDHRIGNPLAAISGAATTLLSNDIDIPAEQQQELLHVIEAEAQRLARIALTPRTVTAEERGLHALPATVRSSRTPIGHARVA